MNVRSLTIFLFVMCVCLTKVSATGPTVNISGGGTGVLAAAITANTTNGATLLIQDSGTYTESSLLPAGPRYSATLGRRSFNIMAEPGMNPTIIINGGMVCYAGSADFTIGSNAGGRIAIDARNSAIGGTAAAIWYIGQEDGLSSGMACQARFENLDIDFRGRTECFVFGAGGNDATPATTSASLTLDNVKTVGGATVVETLYGPADYASTTTINNSQLMDMESINASASGVINGAYGLGGENTLVNITRSIMYVAPGTQGPFESNLVLAYLGKTVIDHSDIISLASTSTTPVPPDAARAVTEVSLGDIAITNSIIRGEVGTAAFGTGVFTADDSNISAEDVQNLSFIYTNVIAEWPVFDSVSSNPADPAFLVKAATQSAALGSSAPIGAKTALAPAPNPARHWSIYN